MEKYPKTPIRISSKPVLDREMKRVLHLLTKNTENDETWELFGVALTNIKIWALEDKAHEYEGFVDHIKQLQRPIIASLSTERTKLSRIATDMLKGLSQAMQRDYEVLQDLFTPTLIRLFARTNKTSLAQYLDCFTTLIDNAKMPKVILRLTHVLKDQREPSKSVRENVAACLERAILANTVEDLKPYLTHIEHAIRTAAMDPAPDVRAKIRACFNAYKQKMLDAASKFESALPPDVKKYLNAPARPTSTYRPSLINRARAAAAAAATTTRPVHSTPKSVKPTVSRSATQPTVQKRVAIQSPARHSAPQLPTRLPARLPIRASALPFTAKSSSPTSSSSKFPTATTKDVAIPKSSSQPLPDTKPEDAVPNRPEKSTPVGAKDTDRIKQALTRGLQSNHTSTTRRIGPMKKPFMLTGMPAMRGTKRKAPLSFDENQNPTKKPSTSS